MFVTFTEETGVKWAIVPSEVVYITEKKANSVIVYKTGSGLAAKTVLHDFETVLLMLQPTRPVPPPSPVYKSRNQPS